MNIEIVQPIPISTVSLSIFWISISSAMLKWIMSSNYVFPELYLRNNWSYNILNLWINDFLYNYYKFVIHGYPKRILFFRFRHLHYRSGCRRNRIRQISNQIVYVHRDMLGKLKQKLLSKCFSFDVIYLIKSIWPRYYLRIYLSTFMLRPKQSMMFNFGVSLLYKKM